MPKNFIPITRNDSAAIFSTRMLALSASLRQTISIVKEVKGLMDSNWTSGDYADLELRFGIPAGQGQTVYGMVRDIDTALDASTDAQSLIKRVG